jgi:hypothetical protein
MNPETKQVSQHMKEFGLHILGRAIYDATFSEMTRPFAYMLSVVHEHMEQKYLSRHALLKSIRF